MVSTNTMRVLAHGRLHCWVVGGVHRGHLYMPRSAKRAKHAVGVAKHELAGHQVIARLQQREEHGAQRSHAGRKTMEPVPPSIWVILASSAAVVGVPWRRVVVAALAVPWKTAIKSSTWS